LVGNLFIYHSHEELYLQYLTKPNMPHGPAGEEMKIPRSSQAMKTPIDSIEDFDIEAVADVWIERQRYVKLIARELLRQGEPAPVPTPLIKRILRERYGITITHQQVWLDLYGNRNRIE
jgi:hypothetical protein